MKAHLEIPVSPTCLIPTMEFATHFAKALGLPDPKLTQIRKTLKAAFTLILETNSHGHSDEPIQVELQETQGKLVISILNKGVPIFIAPPGSATRSFHEMAQNLDRYSIENLGRLGQQILLELALLPTEPHEKELSLSSELAQIRSLEVALTDDQIQIRTLKPEEAPLLSELFFYVYGYRYINEFVYFPEQIRSKIESGKLISTVGSLSDGKLIGHVGLLKMNDSPPVYEACLGIVHPAVKSRGIFGKLFHSTIEEIQKIPMQYCFFDFVTNHDYSQRFVSHYRPCDLALLVGCQNKNTQAKLEKLGLGPDPTHMSRYSLLFSMIPRTEFPFGKEVVLPEILGEQLGFLLEPLKMQWSPSPRFDPLPPEGDYKVEYQPSQGSVLFDFFDPGKKATEKLLATWEDLLRNGYQYAGVDIPLENKNGRTPGLGTVFNLLSSQRFFLAGFLPYRFSNRLSLRLQALGPTEVALNEIKVFSKESKKLLNLIAKVNHDES